jgi:NTP pyrophosphatase (non-canonical NTP hydrolase)
VKISVLQKEVQDLLKEKGFPVGKEHFNVKLVLLHTEVSELADAIKKGRSEDYGGELADIIIRLLNIPLMYPQWGDIWKDSSFESIPEIGCSDPWEGLLNIHREISKLDGTDVDKLRVYRIFALTKGLSIKMGYNLQEECNKKMAVNWKRPYRYGTTGEKK